MTFPAKPTRILFLLHTLTLGGTERHLLRLIQSLDPKLFSLTLLVLTNRTTNDLKPQFESVRHLNIHCGPFGINNPRTFFWAFNFMVNNTFDFIIPFQPRCQFIAALYAHTYKHRGLIVSERGDRLFHDIWLSVFDKPLILPTAFRCIANSFYGCNLLRKRGVELDRIAVIPNGLDFQSLQESSPGASPKAIFPVGRKIIGYCGRLEKVKCLDDLILAARQIRPDLLQQCHFVLIGEGSQRISLENMVKEAGLKDHFSFMGFQGNPIQMMRHFDIGVLVSKHEGSPNVILEMMALGKPVIATAITSIPEIIVHEKTGFLVPVHSPSLLAQAIEHYMNHPNAAVEHGLSGQRLVAEKFNQQRVVADYIALFETALPIQLSTPSSHASSHH